MTKAETVDKYGELLAAIEQAEAALKPARAKAAEYEAEILGWYAKAPAADEFAVAGAKFVARISPCSLKRAFTQTGLDKLFKMLGKAKFLKLATFPLGTLDQLLQPSEREGIITSERAGRRRVSIQEKQ